MKHEAATMSNSVSTISVVPSVGMLEPATRRLTRKSAATSPPRAGTIALIPTRANIAPVTVRCGTCSSG